MIKKLILFLVFVVIAVITILYFIFPSFIYEKVMEYRYPINYRDFIEQDAKDFSLDPALVSAVIFEESRFRESSSSDKGAVGLMQLLPDTADYIAGKIEGQRFDSRNLNDPEKNIRYGCYYLNYLNKKYGDLEKVLAAYNAGEGNVDQWIAEGDYAVKFKETKDFVEKVKRTKNIYNKLYFDKK
ncbi:MAG TPA: lytic transglycosylase domain-containing protein [Patescibacteria group bacterium]|nr:lytic transglycosylase domain-containing protein [Patescibacteria group bacterium]